MFLYLTGETRGLQGDVVYLSWPIASLVRAQMRGRMGGCEVSANENSCAHHVTWSPNYFGHLTPHLTIYGRNASLWPSFSAFLVSPTFRCIFQQMSTFTVWYLLRAGVENIYCMVLPLAGLTFTENFACCTGMGKKIAPRRSKEYQAFLLSLYLHGFTLFPHAT